MNSYVHLISILFVCLFVVSGISTFVGYLMPNPLLNKLTILFQTIQFSINTLFNGQKTFLFQAIQSSQTVLIQTIQFSIRTVFVCTHS